jgi:membrane protease YdiL (CAAX protease family)
MAIASAVGEEMFFRGGIQAGLASAIGPVAGILMASLLFGAMHVPWNRRLWTWTAMATVMGLVFGALYIATGELLACVLAHAVINRENLRYLLATRAPVGKPSTLRVLTPPRSGALGSR